MKVIIFLICALVLRVQCNIRVKRIVGGEKAAIPKPVDFSPGVKAALGAESSKPARSVKTTTESAPANDATTVFIHEEEVKAKVEGVQEPEGWVSFKGIRYADPPVDRNRYQRPILQHPKGTIKADKYGSPCLQPLPDGCCSAGAEDCLFLNIYTPAVYVRNATGLPVLFWIHGGGFTSGSGNQYGAAALVKKNIVVVTINYRLGSLGFFGGQDLQMAGNAGMFDVRAAFEWTRRYIAYFGGDHRSIFTAGQGNGASLATLLAQSDFTTDYLKGVFAMSGTGISSNAVDYKPSNTSNFIAKSSKCENLPPLKTLRCLQKTATDKVLTVDKALQTERIGDGGFVSAISKLLSAGPRVEGNNDGRFLPFFLHESPLDALKQKKISKVPLLIGTAKSETGKALTGKFKDDVLKRLKIPNFITKVLPKSLVENNVGLFVGKIASDLMNLLLNNEKYLGLFSLVSKGVSEIEKVIEATTDALFNLPASTTSQMWDSAGGEAYFYSFEHVSNKSPTKSFLEGLNMFAGAPASTDKSAGSSHGDDLLYLFELQTLEGKPAPEASLKDPKDLQVKQIFVDIVAGFLHTGKPKIAQQGDWPPFKADQSYAVISDKPRVEKQFRYCQIALWGGFLENLQNPICNFPGIKDIVNIIPKHLQGGILNPKDLSKAFEGLIPTKGLPLGNKLLPVPNIKNPLLNGGGLLPGGNKENNGGGGIGLLGAGEQGGGGLLGGGGLFGAPPSKSTSKSSSGDKKPSTQTTRKPQGPGLGLGIFG